jgi:hypothetical protein
MSAFSPVIEGAVCSRRPRGRGCASLRATSPPRRRCAAACVLRTKAAQSRRERCTRTSLRGATKDGRRARCWCCAGSAVRRLGTVDDRPAGGAGRRLRRAGWWLLPRPWRPASGRQRAELRRRRGYGGLSARLRCQPSAVRSSIDTTISSAPRLVHSQPTR